MNVALEQNVAQKLKSLLLNFSEKNKWIENWHQKTL